MPQGPTKLSLPPIAIAVEIVDLLTLTRKDPAEFVTTGIMNWIGLEISERTKCRATTRQEKEILEQLKKCDAIITSNRLHSLKVQCETDPGSQISQNRAAFQEFLEWQYERNQEKFAYALSRGTKSTKGTA